TVDLRDDVRPAGHLRVVPAEIVESLEIDLLEVGWQSEGTRLLAGGVAEGRADGALVDGTHEDVLSGSIPPRTAKDRRGRRERDGILRSDARVRRLSGDRVPPPDRSQPLPSVRDATTITSRATRAPSMNSTPNSRRRPIPL